MRFHDDDSADAAPGEEEELRDLDYVDPLKRDPKDALPGLDPIVPPIPPEE